MTPKELAVTAAKALDSKKGMEITVIDVGEQTSLADYFVICTGSSNPHTNPLCAAVEEAVNRSGEPTLHREGHRGGTWVLLDFGSVVVHVFNREARAFYDLERLWQDGTPLELSELLGE